MEDVVVRKTFQRSELSLEHQRFDGSIAGVNQTVEPRMKHDYNTAQRLKKHAYRRGTTGDACSYNIKKGAFVIMMQLIPTAESIVNRGLSQGGSASIAN